MSDDLPALEDAKAEALAAFAAIAAINDRPDAPDWNRFGGTGRLAGESLKGGGGKARGWRGLGRGWCHRRGRLNAQDASSQRARATSARSVRACGHRGT